MSKLEPTRTYSNPTATEVLRRMLDERGVWWDYGIGGATTTRFNANGVDLTFTPMRDGLVCSTILTPEQAIAATLGAGTCHIVKTWSDSDYVDGWRYRCSECGCFIPVNERDPETSDVISAANYCPNCGRRCVG